MFAKLPHPHMGTAPIGMGARVGERCTPGQNRPGLYSLALDLKGSSRSLSTCVLCAPPVLPPAVPQCVTSTASKVSTLQLPALPAAPALAQAPQPAAPATPASWQPEM